MTRHDFNTARTHNIWPRIAVTFYTSQRIVEMRWSEIDPPVGLTMYFELFRTRLVLSFVIGLRDYALYYY